MRLLYWFRRDLRLRDNRALAEAVSRADKVIALYIIDEEILRERNITSEDARLSLILDLLKELSKEIKLHVEFGNTAQIFDEVLTRYKFEAVFTVKPLPGEESKVDYVKSLCRKLKIKFVEIQDNILVGPHKIEPQRTFTSFYSLWRKQVDNAVLGELPRSKFGSADLPDIHEVLRRYGWERVPQSMWNRAFLLSRLNKLDLTNYAKTKDYPYLDGTSKLSPFINLGAISVRELYRTARQVSEEYIRQLAWREYYYSIYSRNPWMDTLALKPRMRDLRWENDKYLIKVYTEGRTGYPIVDAGIRQLKKENWVHNRVRLILASFLVKDLHVDWKIGEDFFKKFLIDYDKALNVGNWQWAASAGIDPLPLRIFNPIRQSEKYDPMCLYIKKYVPELEDYECKFLHNPLTHKIKGYYEPVVDHYERVEIFKKYIVG